MTDPLASFARSEFSQFGEDGILERLFELLDVVCGYCVEFGAGDGVHWSNSRNLIANHGWGGLLLEADAARYASLVASNRGFTTTACERQIVGFDGPMELTAILKAAAAPIDFDLLSIDIDGNDYHVWESLRGFSPKVVVIEFNPTIPNVGEFIQARDMQVKHGSSIRSLTQLAQAKGYELVTTTICNAIFLRRDLAELLKLAGRTPEEVRTDVSLQTFVLHMFDGTIVLAGCHEQPFVGVQLPRVQVLPRFLRVFPDDAPRWAALTLELIRRLSRLPASSGASRAPDIEVRVRSPRVPACRVRD